MTAANADQLSFSKSVEPQMTGGHKKNSPPDSAEYSERIKDWPKGKEHPGNSGKRAIHFSREVGGKPMDSGLSKMLGDEFSCQNKFVGKPGHIKIDDELHIHPRETNLTPGP